MSSYDESHYNIFFLCYSGRELVKRLGSSSYDESYYNIFFLWEGASQQRGHVQLRRVLQHLLPALQWVGASQTCTASGKTSTSTIPSFYTTVGTSTSTTASICEWKAITFFLCYSGGKLSNCCVLTRYSKPGSKISATSTSAGSRA